MLYEYEEEQLTQDINLLKRLEDHRRTETDPRLQLKSENAINETKQRIDERRARLHSLKQNNESIAIPTNSSQFLSRNSTEHTGIEVTYSDIEWTLLQKRIEALISQYRYEKYIHKLRRFNAWIRILSIVVPVLYITLRFFAKGTPVAPALEIVVDLTGVALLALAVADLALGWQQSEIDYSVMLYKNADISNEALRLFSQKITNEEVIEQFLKRTSDVDNEDSKILPKISEEERRSLHREGLKYLLPSGTMPCSSCGADPWDFNPENPKTCNYCGGNGS